MVVKARMLKGVTQERLAMLADTKQPGIARLENGQSLPSLSFLGRIAKALGTFLHAPRFDFMDSTVVIRSESKTKRILFESKLRVNQYTFTQTQDEPKKSIRGTKYFFPDVDNYRLKKIAV